MYRDMKFTKKKMASFVSKVKS